MLLSLLFWMFFALCVGVDVWLVVALMFPRLTRKVRSLGGPVIDFIELPPSLK